LVADELIVRSIAKYVATNSGADVCFWPIADISTWKRAAKDLRLFSAGVRLDYRDLGVVSSLSTPWPGTEVLSRSIAREVPNRYA